MSPKGGTYSFCLCSRAAWCVRRPQLTLSDHLKKKLFRYLHKFFFACLWWLVLIFSNFWKTRWPPQQFFCWLRILTTSDQLKENLRIYLHQTLCHLMDIRWHKLGWYWFSKFLKNKMAATANFLLTHNFDDVRSIKGKVMNISSPNFVCGYKVA